jgi:hypothetical protein
VFAYAGLRPEEATSAKRPDLGDKALRVHASKTERPPTIRLLAPLARDLAEWRLASGRPPPTALMFPTHNGDAWKLHDWQNWRRRVYQPAAKKAGVTGDLRVYRLRGSFVSLLLWEGRSLTYVADQAGHSVATLAKHYAGVLEELEDTARMPAADAIRQARQSAKSTRFVRTRGTDESAPPAESPTTTGMDDAGLEPATSALSRRMQRKMRWYQNAQDCTKVPAYVVLLRDVRKSVSIRLVTPIHQAELRLSCDKVTSASTLRRASRIAWAAGTRGWSSSSSITPA